MIKNVFILGVSSFLVALFAAPRAMASGAELREVRLTSSSTPRSAQITLYFSSRAQHQLFTLEHPDRVVIDLSNTRQDASVRAPAGTGPVDVIRFGARPQGALRVVLQLKTELPAHAVWVDGEAGPQLVINLGSSPPAPLAGNVTASPPKPVQAMHAPTESNRNVVVAVDAGHGGQDPGAIGRGGTREKSVVLAIAKALAERIDSEPGMRAVLTRKTDQFLTLRERIQRARNAKADLFVSIHADSIRNRAVSGASVYVLSERGATDEAARWLAERENAADLMGGVSLKDNSLASVLLDLSQSANISASMIAAERVLLALDGVGEVRKPQVQQAGFVVLKSPDIPSMLVETAYISNPYEERRLTSSSHQDKLASAIFAGLRGHFERSPPPGTRFASLRRRDTVAGVTTNAALP
jgi:N-acetylmuramoyl-L-alanine amidase